MDVLAKLRLLIENSDMSKSQIADSIQVNRKTLNNWMQNTYPQVDDLMRLAHLFNVPMCYFFDEQPANNQTIKGKQVISAINGDIHYKSARDQEIKQLRTLLAAKDKIITEKERVIQLLLESRTGNNCATKSEESAFSQIEDNSESDC